MKSFLPAIVFCGLFLPHLSFARSWVEVPGPDVSGASSYAIAAVRDNDVWAVGTQFTSIFNTLTEHWDGTSWTVVPSPNPTNKLNILDDVKALASNNVWTVGEAVMGVDHVTLVEHWDGTQWQVIPSPNGPQAFSFLNGVAPVSPNDIWAVGYSDTRSGAHHYEPLALHWDGVAWTVAATPVSLGAQIFGGTAIATDDVWAVGTLRSGPFQLTFTMHWDGALWTVVPSPNVSSTDNTLRSVSGTAANDVWATGNSGEEGTDGLTLALHWNGAAWSVVPTPPVATDSVLNSVVAISSRNVWAVGGAGGQPLSEHWNGTVWKVIPTPPATDGGGLGSISAGRSGALWTTGAQGVGSADQLFLMLTR